MEKTDLLNFLDLDWDVLHHFCRNKHMLLFFFSFSPLIVSVFLSVQVPLLIPCHRVISSSGQSGPYMSGKGNHLKQWLLTHERQRGKGWSISEPNCPLCSAHKAGIFLFLFLLVLKEQKNKAIKLGALSTHCGNNWSCKYSVYAFLKSKNRDAA